MLLDYEKLVEHFLPVNLGHQGYKHSNDDLALKSAEVQMYLPARMLELEHLYSDPSK